MAGFLLFAERINVIFAPAHADFVVVSALCADFEPQARRYTK
jgi:hypothetical protein